MTPTMHLSAALFFLSLGGLSVTSIIVGALVVTNRDCPGVIRVMACAAMLMIYAGLMLALHYGIWRVA